jgi:RNA polymerase sigma factor (sigma-70 family)
MGDVPADRLRSLYAKHQSWLLARARFLCGNTADAEESAQEAFIRLMTSKAYQTLPSDGACVQWLITTMTRLCFDRLRRREREEHAKPMLVHPEEHDPGPERTDGAAWESLTDSQIVEAAESLPPHLRETWVLSAEGLSYSEIAERLGIKQGNVGKRLHDARLKLRNYFQRLMN